MYAVNVSNRIVKFNVNPAIPIGKTSNVSLPILRDSESPFKLLAIPNSTFCTCQKLVEVNDANVDSKLKRPLTKLKQSVWRPTSADAMSLLVTDESLINTAVEHFNGSSNSELNEISFTRAPEYSNICPPLESPFRMLIHNDV